MEVKTIVNLAVNHYQNVGHFGYKGLVGFLNHAAKQVLERDLTESEADEIFSEALKALFN